jgi:peptide deformylase
MGRLRIVPFGDPVLRQTAKPVTVFHKKFQAFVDSMWETLDNKDDGAALAAPQVGTLKRVFVMDYEGERLEMVNPEILEAEGEVIDQEGCLSFSGFFTNVKRFDYIKVKYFDKKGTEHIIERTGKISRCIQHETDHLDGILFVDKMTDEFLVNDDEETKISRQDAITLTNKGL